MITYTTIMGLVVGISLMLVPYFMYLLFTRKTEVTIVSWSATLGGLGATLVLFGGAMSLTWPLKDPEKYKNFMFGEPVFMLGILLIVAAVVLWSQGTHLNAETIFNFARPASFIIFALGLALSALTIGAVQYEVFATAPPQEPLLGTLPKSLVNLSLCSLFAIPAFGCLAATAGIWFKSIRFLKVAGVSWFIAGAGWLIVSVVVYYTHIAMDFNFRAGM